MKLSLYSFNAHVINDANYTAKMPLANPEQGSADIISVKRAGRRPLFAGKVLRESTIVIEMQLHGVPNTQMDEIKAWFDVEDDVPHKLLAKDGDNGDKEWYVYATTQAMVDFRFSLVTIIMAVADPVWIEETESSQAWPVTATADTQNVTVEGNVYSRPRIVIEPTSVGGVGFAYKKFITLYNRTNYALVDYPFNLCLGAWDTGALVANAANSVDIDDGANMLIGAVTVDYDGEVGSFPDSGLAYCENEQFSYTGDDGTTLSGLIRGVNGTAAAEHADGTKIYQSKIQADGDDIRVYFDGSEVDRWLDDINTATTRVWSNVNLQPKKELTLETAIAGAGAITEIKLTHVAPWADHYTLLRMPNSGIVQIGTELFTYTGKVAYPEKLTGVTREAYETTIAGHNVGDTVRFIEHEIWLYYGNIEIVAPDTDDTRKPIFELPDSDNGTWHYHEFMDDAGLRTGNWTPEVLMTLNTIYDPLHKTEPYTGVRELNANPATQMGMSVESLQWQGVWYGDVGYLRWFINQPCGVTDITAVGEKYRYTTKWSIWAKLRAWVASYGAFKSSTCVDVWVTEVTPTVVQTWEATTARVAVALADTSTWLGFEFYSALGATANDANHLAYTDVELTIDATLNPTGVFGAELSNYSLRGRITNNTTGEWFELDWGMLLNTELVVDCEAKTVLGPMNENAASAISFSSIRSGWLNLDPGVNQLQYDDLGTVGLTLTVYWRDRNS